MSIHEDETALARAYAELDYELTRVHDNLEVPTASPVRFGYDRAPGTTDADEIVAKLERESVLTLTDVFAENGDGWYEFTVSATAWTQNDERAKVSISTAGVTICEQHDGLSFESFRDIVEAVDFVLGVQLEHEPSDCETPTED